MAKDPAFDVEAARAARLAAALRANLQRRKARDRSLNEPADNADMLPAPPAPRKVQ